MRFLVCLVKAHTWGLLLFCITACGTPAPTASPVADAAPGQMQPQSETAIMAKITSSIHSVVQRMRADGVTASNAVSRDVSTYSDPLVRVDAAGRIHTAVWVTQLTDDMLTSLQNLGMQIETSDATQGVVQGWMPFERLQAVAALPFVHHIRPPRYASRR